MGAYDRKTGACRYYSQGAQGDTEWFFRMGTGQPVFYCPGWAVELGDPPQVLTSRRPLPHKR